MGFENNFWWSLFSGCWLHCSASTLIEDHGKIFPIMKSQDIKSGRQLDIYQIKSPISVWVEFGHHGLKVQFAQKVLIIEVWDHAQSIVQTIFYLFDLFT